MITSISQMRDSNDALMILAHRGHRFGKIPENTLLAYDAAIALGADIVETDVARTTDDRCVIVHGPLLETVFSNIKGDVHSKSFSELQAVQYSTLYGPTESAPILQLEEVLEHCRGRAIVNVDRAYNVGDLEYVYQIVSRMDMLDQVLFKGPFDAKEAYEWTACHDFKAAYMPIIRNDPAKMESALFYAKQAHFPAIEITFRDDKMSIFSEETVSTAVNLGMKPLVNVIAPVRETLCGGHDDVVSILEGPENGWGWLIDHGAQILQTDCTGELRHYLNNREGKQHENNG